MHVVAVCHAEACHEICYAGHRRRRVEKVIEGEEACWEAWKEDEERQGWRAWRQHAMLCHASSEFCPQMLRWHADSEGEQPGRHGAMREIQIISPAACPPSRQACVWVRRLD